MHGLSFEQTINIILYFFLYFLLEKRWPFVILNKLGLLSTFKLVPTLVEIGALVLVSDNFTDRRNVQKKALSRFNLISVQVSYTVKITSCYIYIHFTNNLTTFVKIRFNIPIQKFTVGRVRPTKLAMP